VRARFTWLRPIIRRGIRRGRRGRGGEKGGGRGRRLVKWSALFPRRPPNGIVFEFLFQDPRPRPPRPFILLLERASFYYGFRIRIQRCRAMARGKYLSAQRSHGAHRAWKFNIAQKVRPRRARGRARAVTRGSTLLCPFSRRAKVSRSGLRHRRPSSARMIHDELEIERDSERRARDRAGC